MAEGAQKKPKETRKKVLMVILVGLLIYEFYPSSRPGGDSLYRASNGLEVASRPGMTVEQLEAEALQLEKILALKDEFEVDPEGAEAKMLMMTRGLSQVPPPGTEGEFQQSDTPGGLNAVVRTAPAQKQVNPQDKNSQTSLPSVPHNQELAAGPEDTPPESFADDEDDLEPGTCSDNLRTVRLDVTYEGKLGEAPCSVWLRSKTAGKSAWRHRLLYKAEWNAEFCLQKARDQLAQYSDWGFRCH